ncbi:Na+/H+ antiporter subunit E [Nocardia vaccinii]|uniref:Na+/H+ antiporter subunit E n=1 Tax=Nocardia vaccinii TaxID=1822 RepID=UPI0008356FB7|nr:Na+/H+ antiporter subunit E [Nocardia vaccinii]
MSEPASGARTGTAVEAIAWWVACVVIWQTTVTTPGWQEWAAAGILAIPVAACARPARRAARGTWRLPAGSARTAGRLIPAIIGDSAGALWLAVSRRGSGGEFTDLPLPFERSPALRGGREAVATVLTCATPGAVVVGSDPGRQRLLVHQMPLRPTAMARRIRRGSSPGDRR